MTDKLYLVTVPVAFMVRSCDEHKATNAYGIIDSIADAVMMDSADLIYFGDVTYTEVFNA